MKKLLICLISVNFLFADITYLKGWNLLGGPVKFENQNLEHWIFKDNRWISNAKYIEKNQGFWVFAKNKGTLKTSSSFFEDRLVANYVLDSFYVRYMSSKKSKRYYKKDLLGSYLKIKSDLSYQEKINIKTSDNKTLTQEFYGKFMPLSNNVEQIVEYDINHKYYFVSNIIYDNKFLILIRKEESKELGQIEKTYTYVKEL